MTKAEKIYPEILKEKWWNLSYYTIVSYFGNVIFSKEFGSYQGDIFYVIENNKKFGYVVIGYGSCSGCDTLQAIESSKNIQELNDFIDSIENSIEWFDTKVDLLNRLKSLNEKNPHYIHEDNWQSVVPELEEFLKTI